MRYLLRTNRSYEHLAKVLERTVLACSEIAVCLRKFFVCEPFLASGNGLYELASTFCHVGLGLLKKVYVIIVSDGDTCKKTDSLNSDNALKIKTTATPALVVKINSHFSMALVMKFEN